MTKSRFTRSRSSFLVGAQTVAGRLAVPTIQDWVGRFQRTFILGRKEFVGGLTECAQKSHTDLIKDSFLSRTIGYDRLAMTTLWQG